MPAPTRLEPDEACASGRGTGSPPAAPEAASRGRVAVVLLGVVIGVAATMGILAAYPLVPNRHTFGWDASLRTMGDLEAARALRGMQPLRFLWHVLGTGPEVWPTLRTLVAAPLLAIIGPSLDAENAISIAAYGAQFALLAVAAVRVARSTSQALLVLAVAAAALGATRPLLSLAAAPFLEVQAALATLGATLAWMRLRERGVGAPVWPVALLGNLVFHSKYQYGILFAIAVLGTELLSLDAVVRRRALGAMLDAARVAARRKTTWLWVVAATACAAAAAVVARSSGGAMSVAGIRVSMSRPHAPMTWAAILVFYGLQLELWRSRTALREAIPPRIRALWTWLATPMAVWVLIPFTWRFRHLVATAATYESGGDPAGLLEALGFYPRVIASEWYAVPVAVAVLAGIVLTIVTAARDRGVRCAVAPIAAVCLVEIVVLSLSRKNFQPRFVLNLAPLVALAAALWVPAAARWTRLVAGGAIALSLVLAVSPLWRGPGLPFALAQGHFKAEIAERCEAVAAATEFRDATLVNDLDIDIRHDCSLRFDAAAWRRGTRLELWHSKAKLRPELIHIAADCGERPAVLPREATLVSERRAAAVCIRVYRTGA